MSSCFEIQMDQLYVSTYCVSNITHPVFTTPINACFHLGFLGINFVENQNSTNNREFCSNVNFVHDYNVS